MKSDSGLSRISPSQARKYISLLLLYRHNRRIIPGQDQDVGSPAPPPSQAPVPASAAAATAAAADLSGYTARSSGRDVLTGQDKFWSGGGSTGGGSFRPFIAGPDASGSADSNRAPGERMQVK